MSTVRSLLEVLKWVDCFDLGRSANQVSRQWLNAASSDEVWDVLREAYNLDCTYTSETIKSSFLRQYRQCYLHILHQSYLRTYNIRKQQWLPAVYVTIEVAFDKLSSLVVLPPCYVLATGCGSPLTAQSGIIHCKTGEVTRLPDMSTPRCRHASLLYHDHIYVFAGSNDTEIHTDTVEKLSLKSESQWTKLPNLPIKSAFSTPCRKDTLVYFFGGWNTNLCFHFDLLSEVFTLLPFTTPASGYLTTSFVHNNDIYFCQCRSLVHWKGCTGSELVTYPVPDLIGSNW